MLKYLLNDKESSPGMLINFPYLSSAHTGIESTITLEDGRVEKYITGRGFNWKYVNGKLQEKITYADLEHNQLPVKIEKGESGWETSQITYNNDQQATLIDSHRRDTNWLAEDGTDFAPFIPGSSETNLLTRHTLIYYNGQRLVSQMTDYGMNKTFTYDANGRLVQADEASTLYKTTKYAYNESGDLIKVTYPDNKVNEMTYNAQGLVTEVKNNDGTKTTMERDSRGDVTAMVDEANRRVELTRDVMGRVLKEKSPSGKEVQYQWGGAGCASCGDGSKLTRITDAANHTWEFKYDIMGNPLEMTYPDDSKISQEYDIAGRLSKFTNKRGQEIDYTYDADGKLTKKTTPEGDIVPKGDSITTCLAKPRHSDANVRDRISEITGNDFHYKYSYGNCQGALDPYWNSLLVKEADVNRGIWTEQAIGYYGLPWETFDSFGWNKVTRFNFSNTPVGNTPNSIYYNKRYVSASSGGGMQIGYTYDNALRVAKKSNYVFHSEIENFFDANGMLSSIYYHPHSCCPSYYPSGRLNFTRDGSGLIKEISQDLGLKAFYNPNYLRGHVSKMNFGETWTV